MRRMLLAALISAALTSAWLMTPPPGHAAPRIQRPFHDVPVPSRHAALARPATGSETGGAPRLEARLVGRLDDAADHPLADLSPEAATYAGSRAGQVAIAVVSPSRDVVFSMNGDLALPMASVAKLAIMVTLMNAAIQEDRDLTTCETALLRRMITVSDNAAATRLWWAVGGGDGVSDYLSSIGLSGFAFSEDAAWGESLAPPNAVAMLLAKLAAGEILTEPFREQALSLMSEVVPAQRWGIPAGVGDEVAGDTFIGVKNGWYPGDEGWRVNSAAVVLSSDPETGYAMAVMTDGQPTMGYGIQTIEQLAAAVDRRLRGW
jgi:hypothetical protein